MLRAVIFDFDGVIANSEPLHFKAFNEVLANRDIKISHKAYYEEYLGFTDRECFVFISQKYNLDLTSRQISDLITEKARIFERLVKTDGVIIDGVTNFVRLLKDNKIRIAICSGATAADINNMLEGSSIADAFEFITSADDISKGKPDPEGYVLTLKRLNDSEKSSPILAKQCIVIEDSHWGLEAAQKAGMHTVAVTTSYTEEELSMADKVVSNLNELTIEDLQKICGKKICR